MHTLTIQLNGKIFYIVKSPYFSTPKRVIFSQHASIHDKNIRVTDRKTTFILNIQSPKKHTMISLTSHATQGQGQVHFKFHLSALLPKIKAIFRDVFLMRLNVVLVYLYQNYNTFSDNRYSVSNTHWALNIISPL